MSALRRPDKVHLEPAEDERPMTITETITPGKAPDAAPPYCTFCKAPATPCPEKGFRCMCMNEQTPEGKAKSLAAKAKMKADADAARAAKA